MRNKIYALMGMVVVLIAGLVYLFFVLTRMKKDCDDIEEDLKKAELYLLKHEQENGEDTKIPKGTESTDQSAAIEG